jgi:GDPmannose 4,6-dehydratase
MQKTALITGVAGQDGMFLANLLLSKGYRVVGVRRRASNGVPPRLLSLLENPAFRCVEGDVTDAVSVQHVLDSVRPDEVYNLAAQSHVATSFEQPIYTAQANYLGVLHILEWLKAHKDTRFYQASTSEMFGSMWSWETSRDYHDAATEWDRHDGPADPALFAFLTSEGVTAFQDEETPFAPNSPYAIAKLAAHNACRLYREAYGVYASCGILFNHESELRGPEFVTRKITKHFAAYAARGFTGKLKLGNLDARRDWGYAGDYVKGMWLMLQQEKPDDFVLATGETHSVREFVAAAMRCVNGLDPARNMDDHVEVDPAFVRPKEVPYLRGCADKAKRELGWVPTVPFEELVKLMVMSDYKEVARAS